MSGLLVLIFAAISVVAIANGQLAWDDPAIAEGPCGFPNPIPFPTYFVAALSALPQGFKLYSPMANAAYFRWMYQKATNQPATTQAQLDSLKPRITFPYIVGLVTSLTQGLVEIFDPPTAYYHVSCIPNNLFLTNATCEIVNPSPGSAPDGFGGSPICSTFIWSDPTAFMEWHCFEGGHQVFNVISLTPTLTQGQINAIKTIVIGLGFKPENIAYQVYS